MGVAASPDGDWRWSEVLFDKESVRVLGERAALYTRDGRFWEYDEGAFFLTEICGDGSRRVVPDPDAVPPGPWRHHHTCTCEVCRLGSA